MPGFCFLSGWGLEPVRRADIDNDGVPALHKAGYIILGGLDHPFEAGRNVPVAGDREVRAAAEVDTARPVADVVGADTCQRIDMPVGGDVEQVRHIEMRRDADEERDERHHGDRRDAEHDFERLAHADQVDADEHDEEELEYELIDENTYMVNGNISIGDLEKIIGIALKNEKTYIMAIGAITNVAMAIMKEPRIIDKIEVIWLGGHSILIKDNMEFNFRQDIEAVRTVFESKVKLTVIPCKNVASNLKTTIYEIEHHLKNKNEVGTYLCERFYNDGKHGIQTRRVIWDISVIAYLINKEWFEISQINCPNIKEDTSYELNTNNRLITMVDFIDSDKIYEDMFEKLGEKNEINE